MEIPIGIPMLPRVMIHVVHLQLLNHPKLIQNSKSMRSYANASPEIRSELPPSFPQSVGNADLFKHPRQRQPSNATPDNSHADMVSGTGPDSDHGEQNNGTPQPVAETAINAKAP